MSKFLKMPSTGLLSMHNRYLNGVPLPSGRKPFRSKERCVIVVVFISLVLMFCGTFFYLPELRPSYGTRESVYKVYRQMQDAGSDLLLPAPPFAEEQKDSVKPYHHHHMQDEVDPHLLADRYKLKMKIEEEQKSQKVLERPDIVGKKVSSTEMSNKLSSIEKANSVVEAVKTDHYPVIVGAEDKDEDIRRKRLKIVEVRFACTRLTRKSTLYR